MKIYFVSIYSKYGGGGMVVTADSKEEAMDMADLAKPHGFYRVKAQDVTEVSLEEKGVQEMAYYVE